MSSVPITAPAPEWSRLVGDSLKQNGVWHTHAKLIEARNAYPNDLSLRGYVEIIRNCRRDFRREPSAIGAKGFGRGFC